MKNIFISLSKYKPSDKADPKENKLTESFAFLLDHNRELCKYFLVSALEYTNKSTKRIKVFKSIFRRINSQRLTIETQSTMRDDRSANLLMLSGS